MVERAVSTSRGGKSNRINHWANISNDILELILERVPAFIDKLSCRAVFSYWHCITKTYLASWLSRLPRPTPLLVVDNLDAEYFIIPNKDGRPRVVVVEEGESAKGTWFYCSKTDELTKFNIRCQQSKKSSCAGSSNGWLIFTEEEGCSQTTLFLYNPQLNVGIRPTSKLTLPFGEHPLRNVILWGNPVSFDLNNNFAIVVTTEKSIAFARYGDCNWTLLDSGDYMDITSSKNYVYALTAMCGVQSWDFIHSTNPLKTLDVEPNLEEEIVYDWDMDGSIRKYVWPRPFYLVESNGELLIVARYRIPDSLRLFLYKLDLEGLEWEVVEEELWCMDRVIFLGKGQCVSSTPTDFPGYERGIYCADHPTKLEYEYLYSPKKIKAPAFWVVS